MPDKDRQEPRLSGTQEIMGPQVRERQAVRLTRGVGRATEPLKVGWKAGFNPEGDGSFGEGCGGGGIPRGVTRLDILPLLRGNW